MVKKIEVGDTILIDKFNEGVVAAIRENGGFWKYRIKYKGKYYVFKEHRITLKVT